MSREIKQKSIPNIYYQPHIIIFTYTYIMLSAILQKINDPQCMFDTFYNIPQIYTISGLFILSVFIIGGYSKFLSITDTTQLIKSKLFFEYLPTSFSRIATYLTIFIELVLPFVILYSIIHKQMKSTTQNYKTPILKMGKLSIVIMVCFTIFISFLFHYPGIKTERSNFLKNIGLVGGLMMLYKYLQM